MKSAWMELRSKMRLMFSHREGFTDSENYISGLIEGTCDVGAVLPDLRWHQEVEPVMPAIVHFPVSLQGAMAPGMRFHAAWRP